MSTINLSLGDIYALEVELSGARNPETGEVQIKGLLAQKLSLVTKFKLKEIKNIIAPYKNNVDELRQELIKKLGEEDKETGSIVLPKEIQKLDKKGKAIIGGNNKPVLEINPKYIEFNQEMEKLLAQTKEINFPELKLEDFDVETDENYEVFYTLFTPAKDAPAA